MDEATTTRELLTWFLGTDDESALQAGMLDIAPSLWPGFSAEAADELQRDEHIDKDLHRRLLGEERHRREYRNG